MTPDLRAALERHQLEDVDCGSYTAHPCRVCGGTWPCDASLALAALDAAEGQVAMLLASNEHDPRCDSRRYKILGHRADCNCDLADLTAASAAYVARLQADAREAERERLRDGLTYLWDNEENPSWETFSAVLALLSDSKEVTPDHCHAGMDGDCVWSGCPQERDGEPMKSGRNCPLQGRHDDD